MPKKAKLVIVALLAMGLGVSLGVWLDYKNDQVIDKTYRILSPARKIGIPQLMKDDNVPFSKEDMTGHWTLMFFGYTHCPDICPTTLNTLAQAKKLFHQKSKNKFPRVVFVSVDPARDTTDVLGEYVRYFDSSFIGITGEDKMLQAYTLQLGVVYMRAPPETGSKGNYVVDHSSTVLLLNPAGELQAYLQPPHSAESILNSVQAVINKTRK
jgi:protein SCO1/2